jgi:hypothetical protein
LGRGKGARIAHYARVAPAFGIHPGKIRVNMAEVVDRKNEIVAAGVTDADLAHCKIAQGRV